MIPEMENKVNRMLKTLYGKLAAVLLGLLCVLGLFSLLLGLTATRMYLLEVHQRLNRNLAEYLVHQKILLQEGQINEAALEDIFHTLMVLNPSIEVYLLDSHGTILAFSAPPGKVKRQRVSLEPIQRFLGNTTPFPIYGDDPRDQTRQKIFSVSPILGNGPLEGYLYVILGGEEYDSVAQMLQGSYILRLSLWTVAAGLLFASVTGLLLFNLLTRRLRKLTAAMETFKQSDFLEPVPVAHQLDSRSGDEIDQLGMVFTHMAERILQQMHKLTQADMLRRNLVANVSHDLRTPLAALRGYLETLLLKEKELTPQERRTYLMTALRHSKRLGKLVAELFELAKLDARETEVHWEPFSLAELVQDIVQKFQLLAEKKKLTIQTRFAEDLPFVSGDIGLIERVLDNLIHNALQYTLKGGTVTISLQQENTKMRIQVADTGCGISPEDLPFIFDRFYRVRKDRQGRSEGAGLGLAIAKRILELHGSPLEVSSIVNSGTTLTFYLPVYHA
jgi:signal transduction histidine kinase